MAKAAEFAGRVGDDFGAAHAVALGYIGDRLGIFRALAEHGPVTSAGLAEQTGLRERYIREWLAAMAASGYITYRPQDATFSMTPEQILVLVTRNPLNGAGEFVYAIACIRQLPKLMDAFRDGGGVAFAEFGPEIVEAIERLFAPGYELFVAHEWIPAVPELHTKLKQGAEVAEVGCGAGQALIPVALAFPRSRFTGYEIDATSIERARIKAKEAGVSGRVSFEQVPAEEIPDAHRYDLIMAFNCIHDMSNPRGALRGMLRGLKPDGAALWSEARVSDRLEENLNRMGRMLYGASVMHCMTVSLADGGEGLGNVVGPETARAMADEAGFSGFEVLGVDNPYHRIFVLRV
jgi:2-polyprenyl-3-methyl-5-hydroxy-6-metoxy-1,4-benzoquinol methylase